MADHARCRLSLRVVGNQFIELFRAGGSVRRQFRRRSDQKNISNLQYGPTFNLGVPDRWFLTFYPSPDIRINYGDPITGQTGRLFLPFDARIGRCRQSLSFELGVPIIKNYPVYNLKTQVRLNVTY